MFNLKTQLIASLFILGTLTFAVPVSAQEALDSAEAAQKINSANELVRQGEFDKAIEEYQQVTPNAADRDELNYNQAVAQFRKGDIPAAQAMFAEVSTSSDTSIAASSRYNLGNCVYSSALKIVEQDKSAAIEQLREAISHYRDSLRLNSDNADARANIELAAEMIRKLKEEQKQEEQQTQDQQQAGDEQSDSQDQKSQKQQQSGQNQYKDKQSKENESEPEKQEQNGQQNDSPQDESSDGQSRDEQSRQDAADEQSQQQKSDGKQNDSQEQQQKNQQQQPSGQQSTGEPQADDPVGEEESDNNAVSAGQLTTAGEQDENGKPTGSVAMVDPNAKEGLMTKEEAMKMLQAVRDRDMLRRLRQEQLERSRHVPVDKDW